MKKVIQQLINSFEIDRMQSTYSQEQIIELLNFKLEDEKQQIIDAYETSHISMMTSEQYYNETFKKL